MTLWLGITGVDLRGAETFRVATYNLENYLDAPVPGRSPKPPEAKTAVCEMIQAIKPDVLAVQEVGNAGALEELSRSLAARGLDFSFRELVVGPDTNTHVAILSRFPITERRMHTNESFLLHGRRFRVSRGFGEVGIQVNPKYQFTLVVAHLKSRRASVQADEAELRAEEAKLLRARVDALLASQPAANLVVLGDFNDTRNSLSTKTILGRGKQRLFDTSPAERNITPQASGRHRPVNWTYYYAAEDTFSRIDYILLNASMVRELIAEETYVAAFPEWGAASDHRPVVATFVAEER